MPRYDEAEAREAVKASLSYSEVLRRLGMRPAGGNHSLLRKWVDDIWRIPTDHFDAGGASIRNLHREPIPLARVLVAGKQFTVKYRTHRYCSRSCGTRWDRTTLRGKPKPASRKARRPPYKQLLDEIESMGFVAVGCKYGVSDNAVRKWVRFYERQFEREEAEATTAGARG